MSGSQPSLHPAEPVFGDADYRDGDAYGLDCRANLALRGGDTIVSVSLAALVRLDGQALGTGDLVVSALGVVPAGTVITLPGPSGPVSVVAGAGQFVSWKGTGGIAGTAYRGWNTYTLASGLQITRSWRLDVPVRVG